MYNFYKLTSSGNNFYVVYTKQKSLPRHSVLKRNARAGLKGAMYEWMRDIGENNTSLEIIDNEKCNKEISDLTKAKSHKLLCERVLLEDVIEKLESEISDLEDEDFEDNVPEIEKLKKELEDFKKRLIN